ncbi:sigma-54-dependent Fis family transcriptional regulator [Candidatus Woesearchaeota archaeon]|nr:sigma-54-dependent Fis family transcriptional regulator [Candidatus Woesearchaeota archaeon]
MTPSLLIIEDETLLGSELLRHFRKTGWEVEWAQTLARTRDLILGQHFEPMIILSDMNLPDGNVLDVIHTLQGTLPHFEWLLLTGYGSVPDSVRAMRLGAYDFMEKPCDLSHLDLILTSALRSTQAQRRLEEQTRQGHQKYSPAAYVGSSQATAHIRDLLTRLTQVSISALVIGGETGAGKGLVARILHHAGKRGPYPIIELNCAALPRDLLESELFGHESGAFTGATARHKGLIEQAHGGTLFLDEIGEMSLELQAKLLKALEDRKIRRLGSEKEITVDVQIIAASHRNLQDMVADKTFRSDLYHRLSVFSLALPPLRECLEDLDELLPLFVAEYSAKSGKQVKIIPEDIWIRMKNYHWPGNVRELRNVVERCVLLADGPVFPAQWLQLPGTNPPVHGLSSPVAGQTDRLAIPLDGSMALDDMDRYIIDTTLNRLGGNVAAAARALGTTRETLRYRVRKYGLKTEPQGN